MTDDDRYGAIVVGVGGIGSAVCSHLAARGTDVLGIERFDVPNAMGSSHGSTRIIRKAYYEHPDYVPLLERAYDLWEELAADHHSDLLYRTGSVVAGPDETGKVGDARGACRDHDLEYELLSGADLADRYPGYGLPDDYRALVQPEGGFLDVEQAVIAHVRAAHEEGAEVHARERVLDWEPTGGGVRVETDRETYRADRLVVTAGAWTPKLVPALADVLVPERQTLGWFQPHRPERFAPERFPVFTMECPEGYFYGFPVHDVPGYKVGKYNHFHETVDPDRMDRDPTRADERVLRSFTERYFPDAAGPTMALSTCLFTNTPDEDFVLDTHPDHPQVVVGAGFSGHGFKFASVVGELLADLALEGDTDHPVDQFGIDRF